MAVARPPTHKAQEPQRAAHRRGALGVGADERELPKVVAGAVGEHGRGAAVAEGRELPRLDDVEGVALLALGGRVFVGQR